MSVVVDLPEGAELTLERAAELMGREKLDVLRDALASAIEDLADYLDAVEITARVKSGEEPVYSAAEVRAGLGLDD